MRKNLKKSLCLLIALFVFAFLALGSSTDDTKSDSSDSTKKSKYLKL